MRSAPPIRRLRWLAFAATATALAVPALAGSSATAALVLLISASRIALGVHFLSDVVGGIVLGLAWLAASTAAFSTWRVERGRRPVKVVEGLEPEAAPDLV